MSFIDFSAGVFIQTQTPPSAVGNRLLASLPDNELDVLFPYLEPHDLEFESTLFETGQPLEYVYFPSSGLISLLATVDGGSSLEVGIIGKEGMANASAALGALTSPSRAIIQGAGTAFRLKTDDLAAYGGSLNRYVLLYIHYLMVQITQSAACYRFHPIEQRLARWLLMTGDRMESNEYRITQDFLSHMLGVRREGVNRAAGELQRKNLISFSRRNILTIDRAGLEATACSCYAVIRREEESFQDLVSTFS